MPKGRRGYYKQPDSIWRESWGNDVVATIVRLQAYLNERWARDGLDDAEAGMATLSIPVACAITGTKRRDYAAIALAKLAAKTSLRASYDGTSFEISWPKYAEFQHNYGRFAREKGPPRPASRVPQKEEQKTDGPERPSPLLRLLSKLEGSPREKELWLAETGPQIEVDAASSRENGKPQTVAQLTTRYYRAYLRRPGREFRAKAEAERVNAAIEARRAAEPEVDVSPNGELPAPLRRRIPCRPSLTTKS